MKNRISELRKAKKLTLAALADKLGVSEGYVSQLQLKKALPGPHRAKLAQIFGVAPDEVAALDAKAVVRRRRKGGGAVAGGARGRRGRPPKARDGLAGPLAAAREALDAIAGAVGPAGELLALLPRLSAADRATLLELARSLAGRSRG
jgi:transcriptional regulator with XRE-family HTH domain